MARLTSKDRKGLSKSQFAEPGSRKYPIENESHARDALSRVSEYGSSSQKKEVRSAVQRKYPGMGKTGK